jgi:hypothetical protein
MTTLADILAKSRTKRNAIEEVIAGSWNTYRYSSNEQVKAEAWKLATEAAAQYERMVKQIGALEMEAALNTESEKE